MARLPWLVLCAAFLASPTVVATQEQASAGSSETLREAIARNLAELTGIETDDLLAQRYDKYRNMGDFIDPGA